jgi:glycosyltransferase involved in cell wall biosynthesis
MKILFTSHRFHPDIGGIEVNSEILAGFFLSQGHEVRLVTQSHGGSDRRFPYPVLRNPPPRELIALHKWADVVYQNNIEIGSLWPWPLRRKPLVIAVRTWIRGSGGRRRLVDVLKLLSLRLATEVIAVSDAIRRDSWSRASVIGNPYRTDVFHSKGNTERGIAIAYAGRLVSDKGVDLLIKAFNRLFLNEHFQQLCSNEGIEPKLTIIGQGDEEAFLRDMVRGRGLESCVNFKGTLHGQALAEELNRHVVLAVPSRWNEPFGNVALEGAACGCVVVGSSGGGLPDAIGPCGEVFTTGNVNGLKNSLLKVFSNRVFREECIKRAPAHLSKHTANAVGERYLEVIQNACLGRGRKLEVQ